jgi:integrase
LIDVGARGEARRAPGGPSKAEPGADAGPGAAQRRRLMAAKAYRLLRAVLTTAVEEDKILSRNPCRVRGAGEEHAAERPVLTVAQVFELAERLGRRPIGNIRKLPAGGYRLRFRRNGEMRTSPELYGTRADAEGALWKMAEGGRVDCNHDRRFRAMVLLATFASLRWDEVTALSRCDLDLRAGVVRVRVAFTQRRSYGSAIILGPPKSRAGRRIIGIPKAIIPDLEQHMSEFVGPEPGALVFCGRTGRPVEPQQLQQDVGVAFRCPVDRG